MRSRGFASFLLLILLAVAVGGAYVLISTNSKQNSIIQQKSFPTPTTTQSTNITPTKTVPSIQKTPSTTKAPDKYGLEAPSLDKSLTWSLVPKDKQTLSNPAFEWHTIKPYLEQQGYISLHGSEWTAFQTINSKEDQDNIENNGGYFYDKFIKSLNDQGWNTGSDLLNLGNYGFDSHIVVGPGNLTDGYFKDINNQMRVVNINTESITPFDQPKGTYPVKIQYHVFVSDIFTEDTLLQSIK